MSSKLDAITNYSSFHVSLVSFPSTHHDTVIVACLLDKDPADCRILHESTNMNLLIYTQSFGVAFKMQEVLKDSHLLSTQLA